MLETEAAVPVILLTVVPDKNVTCGECRHWSGRCRIDPSRQLHLAADAACSDFKERGFT
jgi:hypothetical protein